MQGFYELWSRDVIRVEHNPWDGRVGVDVEVHWVQLYNLIHFSADRVSRHSFLVVNSERKNARLVDYKNQRLQRY